MGTSAIATPQPIAEKGERVEKVTLDKIVPSPFQPRKTFSEESLDELSQSIQQQGIIQPLIVRSVKGKYELIAGERRWRASQRAGLKELPVIVRQASDRDVLELALVENMQRADLNPIEEAEGFSLLVKDFKYTQEQVADRVGKSRAGVANALRLLSLPDLVRGYISSNQLSVGHGKVILSLSRKEEQIKVADRVIRDHLTVRETEKLVQSLLQTNPTSKGKSKTANASPSNADWKDLEQRLQRKFVTKVRLVGNGKTGRIEIDYFTPDDLDRVLQLLGISG
jgi:ParB family chromosome partitioning protein